MNLSLIHISIDLFNLSGISCVDMLQYMLEHDINEGKWIGVGGHAENGESPDCLLYTSITEPVHTPEASGSSPSPGYNAVGSSCQCTCLLYTSRCV